MTEIKENGLIPKLEEGKLSTNNRIKTIHYFDSLYLVDKWIQKLYEEQDLDDLELLKFNIKDKKGYIYSSNDFYTLHEIDKQGISYLTIYNKQGIILPLNLITEALYFPNDYILMWNNIEKYQIKKI